MLDSSTNITFLFNSGRQKRINENNHFPKEHFYGYFNFKKNFINTKFIEYSEGKVKFSIVSVILRKITKFPIYTERIIYGNNKKVIKTSDILIFSNQNVYYSVFPYLLFKNRKKKIVVFIMGYKNILKKGKNFNRIQRFFFSFVVNKIDRIIFLSKNELDIFSEEFIKFSCKASYLPFVVDETFWSRKINKPNNNTVLFVGNDENRDYKKTIEIVNSMKDVNFIIVSSKIDETKLLKNNFQLIDSSWKSNELTDYDLKNIMEKVDISIIPVHKKATQPSGQSVALQCLAMEIPVMISSFEGFWDKELFKHRENIYIVETHSKSSWVKNIHTLLGEDEMKKKISKNGRVLIDRDFNLENFYKNLLEEINLIK